MPRGTLQIQRLLLRSRMDGAQNLLRASSWLMNLSRCRRRTLRRRWPAETTTAQGLSSLLLREVGRLDVRELTNVTARLGAAAKVMSSSLQRQNEPAILRRSLSSVRAVYLFKSCWICFKFRFKGSSGMH